MNHPESLIAAVERAMDRCKEICSHWHETSPACHPQYGPLTSHVSKEWGKSHDVTYRALVRAEKLGLVVRHQPYACAIRWWSLGRKDQP